MANDTFDNTFLCKSPLKKVNGWWQFMNIFGISQTVGNHSGANNDGIITQQLFMTHIFKAFITFRCRCVFMTIERDSLLYPESAQEVQIVVFFGKTVLIIENFIFIKIGF